MHDRFLYSFTDYGDMQTEPHFELIWSLCRKFSFIYIYIYIFQADDDNYFFIFLFFFLFFFFKLRSSKLKSQFHHAPTVFNTERIFEVQMLQKNKMAKGYLPLPILSPISIGPHSPFAILYQSLNWNILKMKLPLQLKMKHIFYSSQHVQLLKLNYSPIQTHTHSFSSPNSV